MLHFQRAAKARGDFERPIQGVEMVLRLSRDIRHRGDSICQLVSVALDGMCCDTMVREILLAPGLRREHCDRLLAALARHEAEAVDPFLESQRVEYLRTRKLLWDYQHRTDVFDMKTLKDKYGAEGPLVFPFASLSLMWALQGTGDGHRLAREKLRLLREADVPGKRPAKSAEFARRVMSMTTEDLAEEVEVVNRVFAAILGSRGMTLLQRSRACDDPKVVEPLRETCVAVFFEPQEFVTISKVCLREETILRGTLCLVALRRWQLDHREPPKDLDTLVKAAGVKGVPIDPYCDQPLRTTVLEDVSVVYSVGPDGKDDGARTVWDFNPSHPGDIVFRLEPPRR